MLQRLLRAISVIMLMIIADRLLSPLGLGWLAYVLGAVAFLALGWFTWRRGDPLDRHIARWLSAGLEQRSRAEAIDEARAALAQAERRRGKAWQGRALRVRLALAELLSADDQLDAADASLEVNLPPTNVEERVALRLARATVALRRGELDEARNLLTTLPASASPMLGVQEKLLEVAMLLQEEHGEQALEQINQVRRQCAEFPSLQLQLRLYHAAALKQLGQADEARQIVAELDPAARSSARAYGLPPIRDLLG